MHICKYQHVTVDTYLCHLPCWLAHRDPAKKTTNECGLLLCATIRLDHCGGGEARYLYQHFYICVLSPRYAKYVAVFFQGRGGVLV